MLAHTTDETRKIHRFDYFVPVGLRHQRVVVSDAECCGWWRSKDVFADFHDSCFQSYDLVFLEPTQEEDGATAK